MNNLSKFLIQCHHHCILILLEKENYFYRGFLMRNCKAFFSKCIVFLLFSGLCFSCSVESRQEKYFQGKVTKVMDGDSLMVSVGRKRIEVRLYGIDAPEYKQSFSNQSRKFVTKKLLGKIVQVEAVTRDTYGRTVSIVSHKEQSINHELVRAGLAWVYLRYCKKKICKKWKKSEQEARAKNIQLWSHKDPVAPWEWRREKRKKGK
jgi:micrococcal nuclease